MCCVIKLDQCLGRNEECNFLPLALLLFFLLQVCQKSFADPQTTLATTEAYKDERLNTDHWRHRTVTHYNKRTEKRRRTTTRKQFEEQCDTLRYYCMRAYKTGWLCASTLYYVYRSFENQCELDFVNCMERYEVWQIAHMSKCFDIPKIEAFVPYDYKEDYFMDNYYAPVFQ